jgi:signal transduction protein with GAF and PtsI domain
MNPSVPPTALEAAFRTGVLDEILAAIMAHFGCQAGTVHLLRDGVLRLAAAKNIPPAVAAIVATVPVGKGIAGLAAQRRAPVSICNIQTDTTYTRPGARSTGMEGTLAVPMLAGGELRGVIGIAKAAAYDWPESEQAELLALAARLGGLKQKD